MSMCNNIFRKVSWPKMINQTDKRVNSENLNRSNKDGRRNTNYTISKRSKNLTMLQSLKKYHLDKLRYL